MNGEIARELIVAGLIAAFGSAAMVPVFWWEIRRMRARLHDLAGKIHVDNARRELKGRAK